MSKPVLTVMLTQLERGLMASAVCQDVDVMRNAHFDRFNEALQYFERRFNNDFRVVLNIPPNVRRTP